MKFLLFMQAHCSRFLLQHQLGMPRLSQLRGRGEGRPVMPRLA